MKETAPHRKRTKSESDSTKHSDHKEHKELKDGHHKSGTKGQHGAHGGHGQHGAHHGPQHGGHHGTHHDGHHGSHGAHHGGHHGGHHHRHKGDHGHHHHHHHTDQGHHDGDHHHSAGSHPIRPRRDTMLSRAHSTHHDDRRSTGTVEVPTPVVFYENTYKMAPDSRIHEGKVREIILGVLKENITETKYDPNMCGQKCQLISEIIKERVKTLNMDRFKIICMVMIGQVNDQSMLVTSRCLWDHRFDNSVSVEYKLGNIIAVGLVFAVYAE